MAWRVDMLVTTEGDWIGTVVDDGGQPVARIAVPEPLVRFLGAARQARPGGSTPSWSFDMPANRKLSRTLLRWPGGTSLRDPAAITDED
jgi:hypothetical protein